MQSHIYLGCGRHCSFSIRKVEDGAVTIADLNMDGKSVTNDAEHVVNELRREGLLPAGRRLFYYDSAGDLAEIVWDGAGRVSFQAAPGSSP